MSEQLHQSLVYHNGLFLAQARQLPPQHARSFDGISWNLFLSYTLLIDLCFSVPLMDISLHTALMKKEHTFIEVKMGSRGNKPTHYHRARTYA